MQFSADFTGDGWADVINCELRRCQFRLVLYVNPKGEARRWDRHRVVPTSQQTEIAVLQDVDGDGSRNSSTAPKGQMRYAKPDPANPTGAVGDRTRVRARATRPPMAWAPGDINGDGRVDILNAYGWWEQPRRRHAQSTWTYHPQAFGRSSGAPAPAAA